MKANRLLQKVVRGYLARKRFGKFRAAVLQKREAERKRIEEQKLREEQERLRIEEERRKEEERKRIEEDKRKEEERQLRLEEEERLRKIEEEKLRARQLAAAIKLQSIFRVLLAQNEANRRYEAKQQKQELIDDAANLVIEAFRENLRKKREARENEKKEQQKQENKEKRKLKKLKKMQEQAKKLEVHSRDAEPIAQNYEKILYLLAPSLLILVASNPRAVLLFVFFCLSTAAGAAFVYNMQSNQDVEPVDRIGKKKKGRASKVGAGSKYITEDPYYSPRNSHKQKVNAFYDADLDDFDVDDMKEWFQSIKHASKQEMRVSKRSNVNNGKGFKITAKQSKRDVANYEINTIKSKKSSNVAKGGTMKLKNIFGGKLNGKSKRHLID